ncbi:hypothetical protein NMY22_g18419 [Coprinellus aureogranulatus]|nr:hypothetical protein NMY22_g18419 [Coprinellus aureogranulatus]
MSSAHVLSVSNAHPVTQITSDPGTSNRLHKKHTSPTGTRPTTSSKSAAQNTHFKKIPRKASKPILTWFQRKLGGSVKAKRSENAMISIDELGYGRTSQTLPRASGRAASSPLPLPAVINTARQAMKRESGSLARRTTFSDEDNAEYPLAFDDSNSIDRSSYARDSLWSPTSALEADDDASVRPIPPSAPPSPSPSRSSSSYLSDPRTFRSMSASTKPTTVLSIDLGNNGMAHIAQVPQNAPTNPVHRIAPHLRNSSASSSAHVTSGNSITFSAIPSSPQHSSRPSSVRQPGSISSLNFLSGSGGAVANHIQAPLHTAHHPRNNPRPSSPPLDNASMLTLASSAFAHPGRTGLHAYSINTTMLGDNASHYGESVAFPDGESTSQFLLGDEDRLDDRDVDASVRALRPRSSRRGSWESEVSRWSARVQTGPGTPSLVRDRSVWTSNSIRTGAMSADYRQEDDDDLSDNGRSEQQHEFQGVPSILVGKDEESDRSVLTRDNLEVPPEGSIISKLHRPSTETIAQLQTPQTAPTSEGRNGTVTEAKSRHTKEDTVKGRET